MTLARAGGSHLARIQYLAVVRKEALQTLRDRRIMFLLIVTPLLQTLLYGFAVDFDVDRVRTVTADLDQSPASRDHLRRLLADGTLLRVRSAGSAFEADRLMDAEEAAVAVIVPKGFSADLAGERTAKAQVVVDGSDPVRSGTAGSAAMRYFEEVAPKLARARLAREGRASRGEVEVIPRVLFNQSLKTAVYMVPGILAILLVVVTTIVSAMGLSREREMGTMEQVLVTPVKPFVLLAGKMTPFIVIGLFDVLLALTAMTWIFAVPVRGPLIVLALGTLLYLCTTLGVGLLISTVSSNQQQSFLGGFLFILPAALLSGIMTPIRAMPRWLQAATWLNPLRFFAELVRGVLLRGTGLQDAWVQIVALALYGAMTLALATVRFRSRLG
ncbi:MAG TPA: ABC transporter permease [Anaeromyxobacteraceae bacterium]|nr:ABC transporter permease [Anaeromyxobacteraceae bacterium]